MDHIHVCTQNLNNVEDVVHVCAQSAQSLNSVEDVVIVACCTHVCAQSLNNVEDAADVEAADRVQAELALLCDVSGDSELKKLPPTKQHHSTSPGIGLSEVS